MKSKTQRRPHVYGNAIQAKTVKVSVTQADIDGAKCGIATKCMIAVALKRALNLAHGYIHVDATGVSISRNGTFREKSFLPRPVIIKMVAFDKMMKMSALERAIATPVTPFGFTLSFIKTTPVNDLVRLAQKTKAKKKERAKAGYIEKKYDIRSRVIGVAVAGANGG